jgi:uncharacterized protein (DUF1778 family)
MPRLAVEDNHRLALRVRPEDKTKLLRAVGILNTDITSFILEKALRAADSVIEEAERVSLSERDSFRVLQLLDRPPQPNERLRNAAKQLPPLR